MQIKCNVDQAEAIRRGFSADSTVKLEVEVSALSEAQRIALAHKFSNGAYETYGDQRLSTPTVEGLMESLDKLIQATTKDNEDKAEREKNALLQFDVNPRNFIYYSTACGAVLDSTLRDATLSAKQMEIFKQIAAEVKVEHELQQSRKLTEETTAKELRISEDKVKQDKLRTWAQKAGSDTLKLRLTEGFSWEKLAVEEWAEELLRQAGLGHFELAAEIKGYNCDITVCDEPTLKEMQDLKAARKALLKVIPQEEFTLKLCSVVYSASDEEAYDEPLPELKQNEFKLKVTAPNGWAQVKYYKA